MGYFLFLWLWFMDWNHAIAGLQVRQQVDFESVSVSESLRLPRRRSRGNTQIDN